jgi:hypothetical protein
MRKFLWLMPLLFLLTGCDQQAADFAKKTDELLTEYQKRIDDQIAAATTYYHQAAALLATENTRVALATLQNERNERSTELEADYRENRRPPSLYRTHLRDYANDHFDRQKEWLTADSDATAPYLAQLVALESDKATIDAYSKILKNLAQPRGIKDEIGDITKFVSDSKTEFHKLVCGGIATQITDLSTVPQNESAADKAAREKKLAVAKQLKIDQKCQ